MNDLHTIGLLALGVAFLGGWIAVACHRKRRADNCRISRRLRNINADMTESDWGV